MKRYALALALAGMSITGAGMAADLSLTFAGTIHDHSRDSGAAATQCVVIKGPKYTLQTETEAWVLPDEQMVAKYAGKRVLIRGEVSDGNKLKVIEIVPAK